MPVVAQHRGFAIPTLHPSHRGPGTIVSGHSYVSTLPCPPVLTTHLHSAYTRTCTHMHARTCLFVMLITVSLHLLSVRSSGGFSGSHTLNIAAARRSAHAARMPLIRIMPSQVHAA